MLNKLRTVIYHVTDLEAAKTWYENLTSISPYFNEPFYVGFNINGFELGLDPDVQAIQTGNNAVAYWSVNDIHAAVEKAESIGAITISAVQNVGGKIKVVIIQDPFGNCIGFISEA
jgi:predicted enzyme related to lactoylglutathione lyase